MNNIFVNFTNHPSSKWDQNQKLAAEKYGKITDIPFPAVDPWLSEEEIDGMAASCVKRIMHEEPCAVLCQGEYTLCFKVVEKLKSEGVTVLSACSERRVIENGNRKTSVFEFVKFRKY